MTTTLIKINTASAKMKNFTGMESFNFKMVSILFIIVLNVTSLSSQTFGPKLKNSVILKPTVSYNKKPNVATRPAAPKVYNVHIVREFPILEGVSKQDLKKMDELEVFDYELIFGNLSPKAKSISKKF